MIYISKNLCIYFFYHIFHSRILYDSTSFTFYYFLLLFITKVFRVIMCDWFRHSRISFVCVCDTRYRQRQDRKRVLPIFIQTHAHTHFSSNKLPANLLIFFYFTFPRSSSCLTHKENSYVHYTQKLLVTMCHS